MDSEDNTSTIHLIVRNESFELSSSLLAQLVKYSSSLDFIISASDKQHEIYLNVDPRVFNIYLLYIQSGCFVQPNYLSQEDLINGLRICGAPYTLINHYEGYDLLSLFSWHHYCCQPIDKKKRNRQELFNVLVLSGLFIATCVLTIDLYRQMLILNQNSYQETSQFLIIIIYLIDSLLFLYSCMHGILKFISDISKEKRLEKDPDLFIDMISCLGILCYFASQRPITNVYLSDLNSFWIFVHMCRTIRLAQIGYRLIDIQWCLYAITECLWTFLQTIIGLFWVFIFSGSMLYTMDMIENNQQYSSIRVTILSAHETLFTIGYRNNAPYGRLTRLWTIISIYFMSSLVQLILWSFQTKVTIEWKNLLDKKKEKTMSKIQM